MNSRQNATARRARLLASGGAALFATVLAVAGCGKVGASDARINSATRIGIADIAEAGGDVEGARSILAAATAADPDNGDLQLRYAAVLLQTGRAEAAVGAARQAVAHNRHDMPLALRAARLELQAGDATLAAATFATVAASGTGGTAAFNGLGVARVQAGDLPGAEAAFRRAIALRPGDYAARNNLALALVLQGRADAAVPMLQSLADEPGVPGRVTHNLALAYAQQGDMRQAAAVLQGVEDSAHAAREAAAFNTLRTDAPTMLAGQFGPAEVLNGQTSGTAYAGAIPGPVPTAAAADAVTTPVAPPPWATAAAPVLLPARVTAEAPHVVAPAAAAPTRTVAVVESAESGTIAVRIATVPTRPAAMAFWRSLTGMVPELLDGRTPELRLAKRHGHASWRLGTGGFQDVAAAEQFCRRLRARGPNCAVGL